MDRPPASPPSPDYAPSSLPSLGARILAFAAIVIGGLCGGLIGYGFTDLQCTDGCTGLAGGMGVLGAAIGAAGVGVVAVLALRAMGEWRTIQHRDDD
ncbi:MAG: hypothetical protein ABWZ76_09550 [Acidimicrobiales bacterium]